MGNPLKRIIRDFTLAINGVPFNGDCDQVTLPELSKKMEEYRGGGMDSPIEIAMGYEKKELEFELTSNDPTVVSLIGFGEGQLATFIIYAFMQSHDGQEEGAKIECQGEVKKLDKRELKAGDKVKLKFTVAVSRYKESQNNMTIIEHDPLAKVLIVNGVDLYANRRTILGL